MTVRERVATQRPRSTPAVNGDRRSADAPTGSLEQAREAPVRVLLAVIATAVFLSTLTGSMVTVILPLMRSDFDASAARIGWVVTGYSLAYAVGVPLYGRVSDIFGIRRVFSFGLAGFAVGGLICALAPNLGVLVAGRVIQGAGGAAVPALAAVTVARKLPAGQRGSAMGLVASSVGIGSSVGPIVGGTLGDFAGWRMLFLGSLALTLLLVPFAWRLLPEDRAPGAQRFDLAGGVLLGLGAGLFLFGITQAQIDGVTAPTSWGSFLVAGIATAAFIRRINRAPAPFVNPALFGNRAYLAALLVGFFAMFANLSALVFVPLMLVEANDLSARAAGLVLTPGAIALALVSPLAGRVSDRVGVRAPIVAGLTVMTLATLLLSISAGASPYLIALGVVGVGAGFAGVQSPLNNAAANALRQEEVGAGMGLFAGAFFLGSGTGPAVVGAVLAAREESGGGALNPLHAFDAAAFSDAFLVILPALLLGMLIAARLQPASPG